MGKSSVESVLKAVPPLEGNVEIISRRQNTSQIVKEVLDAHSHFAGDYDLLVTKYKWIQNESIEEQLYEFCRENLHYNAESEQEQTTRSPAGIIELGGSNSMGCDCKHYSGYIAGCLDAINRNNQEETYPWAYRFASYDNDPAPGHVFVVVYNDDGTETWIDPVLSKFNKRFPSPVTFKDKRPSKMPLMRISGPGRAVGCPDCGGACKSKCAITGGPITSSEVTTTASGQSKIETVGSALSVVGVAAEAIPVVGTVGGTILIAVGALTKLAGALLGSKWTENNEVRWMLQQYQYYVLGQANVRSDNDVNETYTNDALAWFYSVLGVPVYDANTVAILANTNSQGQKTSFSPPEQAARYLAYPQIAKLAAGVTLEQAQTAGIIGTATLNFYSSPAQTAIAAPGSWANLPVAQSVIDAANAANQAAGNGVVAVANQGNILTSLVGWVKANPLPALGILAIITGGAIAIFGRKKKKKSK
jgi:hypothetical protein